MAEQTELDLPAPPPVPPRPTRRTFFAGLTRAQMMGGLLILGALVWGMWVTKLLIAPKQDRIVSARLSSIVGEYVQAQARSATPPDQVSAETRAFMGEIQRNLEKRGAAGQLVLVGEAVVAGNVPDITADVRREVYARVKMPQAAAASGADVMGAMRAAMGGQGTPQGAPLGAAGNAAN